MQKYSARKKLKPVKLNQNKRITFKHKLDFLFHFNTKNAFLHRMEKVNEFVNNMLMSDLKLSKIQMSEAVEYNDALEHNK